MICSRPTSFGPCGRELEGGPREWSCPDGHVWWGAADGARRTRPWPADAARLLAADTARAFRLWATGTDA